MATERVERAVPQWTFADRLRKVRREIAHLTQDEFADRLGVSAKAVAAWESGRTQPRSTAMLSIAARVEREFACPATWLLGIGGDHPNGADTSYLMSRAVVAA